MSRVRSWWRPVSWTALVVALGAVTVWLLSQGTRGAEVANVLALPVAALGLVVGVVAVIAKPRQSPSSLEQIMSATLSPPSALVGTSDRDPASYESSRTARVGGRAMTKKLFFLCGAPAPLHDAAAELRRAGYLVKGQPSDLDGTWSLQAYSAASELSKKDLATLDDIARRCGVLFDGWGTYVGPPDKDDGPGRPPGTAPTSRSPVIVSDPVIRVVYEPDPGDEVFDSNRTPMLVFGERAMFTEHPQHSEGWVLYYLEPDGDGVEDHFVGGTFDELPQALESAKTWLRLQRQLSDEN